MRRRLAIVAALVAAIALPVGVANAQRVLPGTTVGENCTIYREIPAFPERIGYYQCRGGSTVKFVSYTAANGEAFQYAEWRDEYGMLFATTFTRYAAAAPTTAIPLADSAVP